MKKEMALEARKKMLKKLKDKARKEMHSELPEKLGEMKSKVVISADSPEGLKEGLSKAEKILDAKMGDEFACGGTKGKKYAEGGMPEEKEEKPKYGLIDSLMKKSGPDHNPNETFGQNVIKGMKPKKKKK